MMTEVEIGKILQTVRKDAGYTQSDIAKIFNYDTSVISKIENARMAIMTDLYVNWLKKFGREDIFILTLKGVPAETILKECFTKEYKEKLKHIKSQPPSPEMIEKVNKLKREYGFE